MFPDTHREYQETFSFSMVFRQVTLFKAVRLLPEVVMRWVLHHRLVKANC